MRNNKGFSLVELIVVIAIMAVLAAVAVIGVSIYIPKAQQAADKQLVSDIEQVMNLYYQSNAGEMTGGYVILTQNGAKASANLEQAMAEAFGANWESELALAYDGWAFDKNLFSSMVSVNGNYISAVPGSSYINGVGTDALLEDVQLATSQLAEFLILAQNYGADGSAILNGLLGGDAENNYLSVLEGYDGEVNAQVLANATVFGIASTLDADASADVIEKFSTGHYINRFKSDDTDLDPNAEDILVDTANTYAALEAYVGYVNKHSNDAEEVAAVNAAFDKLKADMQDPNVLRGGTTAVVAAINTCGKEIRRLTKNTIMDSYFDGPSASDGKAYIGIMQTVNGLSGDYKNNLGDDSLFTNGDLANRVDNFVLTAGGSADLSALSGVKNEILNKIGDGSTLVVAFAVDANGAPQCTVLFLGSDE